MAEFYTSDNHFGHFNVIKFCDRPFISAHEMNVDMTDKWNSTVSSADTVYHLGDFCFGPKNNTKVIREKLNGRIILVAGNHDRSQKTMLELGLDEVHSELLLDSPYGKLLLTHKPRENLPGYWFNLHGHVHDSWKFKYKHINVGVDVNNFYPRTLEELFTEYNSWAEEHSKDMEKFKYEIRRVQDECNREIRIPSSGPQDA